MIVLASLLGCNKNVENQKENKGTPPHDLIEIKLSGELRALVDNSSTSYFIYKGNPMGYEYELLSEFAKAIDVDLKIIPIENLDHVIDSLNNFKGDVIAANLTVTKKRKEAVEFSSPLIQSKQILIQRNTKEKLISSPMQLEGKEVYVRKNSSFFKRLENLSEEIGGEILIQAVAGNITVEELIKKVSEEEIDYTIADQHVAKINASYYRNLNIRTAISLEQEMAWAVRKESPDLLIAMNEWLRNFKKTADFRVIYLKYFGNTSLYKSRIKSELYTAKSGMLSPYDDIIKKESKNINWDWRLLTSLIYQESNFDSEATSWAGASGLMQLMPETAQQYGVDSSANDQQNITAGVNYLKWIDQQFQEKIVDENERRKFVLAAYNVGLGHIFDAIRLAEKYELNPEIWFDNVAEMLLNKSKPKYYKDEVVYYGYCRGSEPYNYVNEILNRFEHYKNSTD